MRAALIVMACALLAGCAVQDASGPSFGISSIPTLGQSHVYIYRTRELYLAEAPDVVSAEITIDGKAVGYLENGGFLVADLTPGSHLIWADQSRTECDAKAGQDVFISVSDNTRMNGLPALAGGAIGGAIGGMGGGTIGGAIVGAAASQREMWRVERVMTAEALQQIRNLKRSD